MWVLHTHHHHFLHQQTKGDHISTYCSDSCSLRSKKSPLLRVRLPKEPLLYFNPSTIVGERLHWNFVSTERYAAHNIGSQPVLFPWECEETELPARICHAEVNIPAVKRRSFKSWVLFKLTSEWKRLKMLFKKKELLLNLCFVCSVCVVLLSCLFPPRPASLYLHCLHTEFMGLSGLWKVKCVRKKEKEWLLHALLLSLSNKLMETLCPLLLFS